jgi:fucose 4-O-acetylase-like acetyltransferase
LNKRIEWIDFGKVVTMSFVVLVHVINNVYIHSSSGNLNYLENSMVIIFMFIMPVFFAFSGYLYRRPASVSEFKKLIIKKFKYLMFPFFGLSIAYIIMQQIGSELLNHPPMSWSILLLIFVKPFSYLWYLYVLFFLFVLQGVLDLFFFKNKLLQAAMVLLFFVIALNYPDMPEYLYRILTNMICFYIGVLLNRYHIQFRNHLVFLLAIFLFLGGCYVQKKFGGDLFYDTNGFTKLDAAFKLISIYLCLYIYQHVYNWKFFSFFKKYSKYSFYVYLAHFPLITPIRYILEKAGIHEIYILITLTTFIVLGVCLLFGKLFIAANAKASSFFKSGNRLYKS